MRATVQLIPGRENRLFQIAPGEPGPEIVSWDPDESDQHDTHTALHPGCLGCVAGTGDWQQIEPAPAADAKPKQAPKGAEG